VCWKQPDPNAYESAWRGWRGKPGSATAAVNEALNKAQDKAEKAAQITERIRLRTEDCYIKSMRIPTKVL